MVKKCIAILKIGKRKGCRCNRRLAKNNPDYCKKHKHLQPVKNPPTEDSSCAYNKVGEGTYGCVFKPPLPCKGKLCKDSEDVCATGVSKLMTKQDARKQLSEYQHMDKFDPEHQYHLGKPYICQPDKKAVNLKRIKTKCKSKYSDKFNAMLIYPDGGVDLYTILNQDADIREYTNAELEIGLLNIFYGVYIMNNSDHYHLDLKTENIVVLSNGKNKIPKVRLIDFGIAYHWNETKLHKFSSVYANNYFAWPFELRLLSLECDEDELSDEIDEYLAKQPLLLLTENNIETFERLYAEKYQKCYQIFARHYDDDDDELDTDGLLSDPEYIEMAKYAIHKVDVYSLGILLFNMSQAIETKLPPDLFIIANPGQPGQKSTVTNKIRLTAHQAYKLYRHYLLRRYDVETNTNRKRDLDFISSFPEE